jgi:hypothetical protein
MSNGACASFCDSKGLLLAGTEYSGQCFCGNALVGSQMVEEGMCDMPCTGAAGEVCGGKGTLSVWMKTGGSAKTKRHLGGHAMVHKRRAGRVG